MDVFDRIATHYNAAVEMTHAAKRIQAEKPRDPKLLATAREMVNEEADKFFAPVNELSLLSGANPDDFKRYVAEKPAVMAAFYEKRTPITGDNLRQMVADSMGEGTIAIILVKTLLAVHKAPLDNRRMLHFDKFAAVSGDLVMR